MAVVAQRLSGRPAFEIKGTIAPVTVLCLCSTALDAIETELRARIAQAPQMFLNAPIVIDVADVESELESLSLSGLVARLRACKLMPVGIAHLPADRVALAVEHDLAILQLGFGRTRGARANSSAPQMQAAPSPPPVAQAPAPTPAAAPSPAARAEPPPPTLTITSPVRGGQVVYAAGTDLVVMAAVNPGAQVIADGHIHVYGRLMGRALAGAHGRSDARVFCSSLEAELVSVGGEFLSADEIPEKLRGKSAQIFVEHGTVRVASL
ncbi:MAG TPA: septum site-determining protein MinC [Polyangia bacterium]|jgi:septum site-determining protein MinC